MHSSQRLEEHLQLLGRFGVGRFGLRLLDRPLVATAWRRRGVLAALATPPSLVIRLLAEVKGSLLAPGCAPTPAHAPPRTRPQHGLRLGCRLLCCAPHAIETGNYLAHATHRQPLIHLIASPPFQG